MTLCEQARRFAFASVCVNPYWVALAKRELSGSASAVCTVIGFPLGANETATKLQEAQSALERGATELDAVQNVGALLSGGSGFVAAELEQLARLAHRSGARLKVILETCLLTVEDKVLSCRLAEEAGADFVKTSTGFAGVGATVEDVRLLRSSVSPHVGVKASGGIRNLAALRSVVDAGANRIGTSAGVSIVAEAEGALSAATNPAHLQAGY